MTTSILRHLLLQAKARWQHASGCKSPLGDCARCQAGIRWFADLPLPMLARVLQESATVRRS